MTTTNTNGYGHGRKEEAWWERRDFMASILLTWPIIGSLLKRFRFKASTFIVHRYNWGEIFRVQTFTNGEYTVTHGGVPMQKTTVDRRGTLKWETWVYNAEDCRVESKLRVMSPHVMYIERIEIRPWLCCILFGLLQVWAGSE